MGGSIELTDFSGANLTGATLDRFVHSIFFSEETKLQGTTIDAGLPLKEYPSIFIKLPASDEWLKSRGAHIVPGESEGVEK